MKRRADAAQATLDRVKDKPFAWGSNDCARMVAFHLRQLGYKPGLSKGGTYRTALSAKRALARAGFVNLAEAMDALGLERIAPAFAVVGDIVELPGDANTGALFVSAGNGRVIGFQEDAIGGAVLAPLEPPVAAWRVHPRG